MQLNATGQCAMASSIKSASVQALSVSTELPVERSVGVTHGGSDSAGSSLDYLELFEHAPTGYVVLDAAGNIERINQTGADILGWDAVWLAGQVFERWIVDSDKSLFASHRRRLRCGTGAASQELRLKNRQGRIVTLRLESVLEAKTAERDPGIRCAMIDVSGEQQSARKLRQLQSQLAHVARLNTVGEMASGLAHELNQPLGTVVLNCETALRLLECGQSSEFEFAAALNQARDAASFASEVVRHLRGFLRNNGDLQTVCQLHDVIQDVAMLIRADARDNGMELRLDIEPDLPCIRVDSVQIEQVLLNLTHNSVEAMRENGDGSGRITLSARRSTPASIQVTVADTGPGLDAGQLSQIFTPFFTTKCGGMGMGLSISRNIIEAHGGQIWADAELGKGTIVHFLLPTIIDPQQAD